MKLPSRSERGQMILMVAGSLLVILFFAALTIDIGFQTYAKRNAQNDADAMALAGAQELDDPVLADSIARDWGARNGVISPEVTNITVNGDSCNDTPPDVEYITVRLKRSQKTFFAQLFGLGSTEVNVCATARATFGQEGYAIFANNPDCPGDDTLEMNGSVNVVNGKVHSNGLLKIPGSDIDFNGDTTYTCEIDVSGSQNTFTPPHYQQPEQPFPYDYEYSDFPCTYTFSGDVSISSLPVSYWVNNNPATKELKPGVYCQSDPSKKIDLNLQGLKGNVTFVTHGLISGGGSDFDITAFHEGVLFFTDDDSDSAIDVSGSDGSWEGIILAPEGRIKLAGSSNLSLSGSLIGDRVQASGSSWSLTAYDDSDGKPLVKLVE